MPDAIDDIQRLMAQRGLSQVELARKIEVSPEALSRMLRDDRRYPPSRETLERIAGALGYRLGLVRR